MKDINISNGKNKNNNNDLKIKSELILLKTELNNYKNQNLILLQKNKYLKNLIVFNKNKCNILKKNFAHKFHLLSNNKTIDFDILDKITLSFHSLINNLLDILEIFIFDKSTKKKNNSFTNEIKNDIKKRLINKLEFLESNNIEWLDGLSKEINRIKNWNDSNDYKIINEYKFKTINKENKKNFSVNISRGENKSLNDKFRTTKETCSLDDINSLKHNNSANEINLKNFIFKSFLIKKPRIVNCSSNRDLNKYISNFYEEDQII